MSSKNVAAWDSSIIAFIIEAIVSMIIIYIVTKLLGEKGGIARAFVTAILGAIVYAVTYHIIGNGLIAAGVGGIIWLLVLKASYNIGWLKALATAAVIWIVATVVGFILPTLTGPL